MDTHVLLLRHAQSSWNAAGRWQGWADAPLSTSGMEDAQAGAEDPVLDEVGMVVASDLRRASATADAIAAARGLDAVRTFRGLRERGAGEWTGLTRTEIEATWPGALERIPVDIPGGEAVAAVTARAVATLHRIAAEWPGLKILAVSHGALIRAVEHHIGSEPTPIPNLSGRWVIVSSGRIRLGLPAGPLRRCAEDVGQVGSGIASRAG